MQFNIVKYSEGDKCEDFDDPYVQVVFRARRTTPPAAPVQEPVQEPVAWQGVYDKTDLYYRKPVQGDVRPLYTTPPAAQRTWVGLTVDEIDAIQELHLSQNDYLAHYAYAVEAKLKEKNT
jgi:hypothetical protein